MKLRCKLHLHNWQYHLVEYRDGWHEWGKKCKLCGKWVDLGTFNEKGEEIGDLNYE